MDPAALIAAARAAALNAYAPYSRFAVGAAVLLDDGTVVTGANFENASYGLSLCAETVALATASAQGRLRDVAAVAIVGGAIGQAGAAPVRPCGRCRQVLSETGRNLTIYCAGMTGEAFETHRLSDLLPFAFGPGDLATRLRETGKS